MDNETKNALVMYEKLCKMLDELELKYDKDPDQYEIECRVGGDDLPMDFVMRIHPNGEFVDLLSRIPITVPQDKILEVAIAATYVNNLLVDGCFDLNIEKGTLLFRTTNFYKDSDISTEALQYMLLVSHQTVETYNDKFFMMSKGMLSLADFKAFADA
ncbi:MAG: hypothetical protein IJO93_06480 [Clostridia bacterium]|nr:hypothetical protein [Clostridia bacterium]